MNSAAHHAQQRHQADDEKLRVTQQVNAIDALLNAVVHLASRRTVEGFLLAPLRLYLIAHGGRVRARLQIDIPDVHEIVAEHLAEPGAIDEQGAAVPGVIDHGANHFERQRTVAAAHRNAIAGMDAVQGGEVLRDEGRAALAQTRIFTEIAPGSGCYPR